MKTSSRHAFPQFICSGILLAVNQKIEFLHLTSASFSLSLSLSVISLSFHSTLPEEEISLGNTLPMIS